MKTIGFIADFFSDDVGKSFGGESNDSNLINFLEKNHKVIKLKSKTVTKSELKSLDFIIVGNFIFLPESVKKYLTNNKKYVIYEHDHKYIVTRDPSRYLNFEAPKSDLINVNFYQKAQCVVVLSDICERVIKKNVPNINTHNIGCSLWAEKTFDILERLRKTGKEYDYCIIKSQNPTKNYANTLEFCRNKGITPLEIKSPDYHTFLRQMSKSRNLIFLPTVLETYSRVCAEAKMLGMSVMTNKRMIGFFSEEISSLSGSELVLEMKNRNNKALQYFNKLVK